MIAVALFAIIGAALKLSGGLAIAYWILFGLFCGVQAFNTTKNIFLNKKKGK